MCVLLGHNPLCLSLPSVHDLVHQGEIFRALHTNPIVSTLEPKTVRAVLALMENFGVVPRGSNSVTLAPLAPYVYEHVHSKGFETILDVPKVLDFQGSRVTFVGVPPSILSHMMGVLTQAGPSGFFDYAFVSTPEAYYYSLPWANTIWLPPFDLKKNPYFRATGRKFGSFSEYWVSNLYDIKETHVLTPTTQRGPDEGSLLPRVVSNVGPYKFVPPRENVRGTAVYANWSEKEKAIVLSSDFPTKDIGQVYFSSVSGKLTQGNNSYPLLNLSMGSIHNLLWGSFNNPTLMGDPGPKGIPRFRFRGQKGSTLHTPNSYLFSYLNGQFYPRKLYDLRMPAVHVAGPFKFVIKGMESRGLLTMSFDLQLPEAPWDVWNQLWIAHFHSKVRTSIVVNTFPPPLDQMLKKELVPFFFPSLVLWGLDEIMD